LAIEKLNLKRLKLSEDMTKKLRTFKGRTGITPNIACRLALGLSLNDKNILSLDLHFNTDDLGLEINRYTLFGEHEDILISLFLQWCLENSINFDDYTKYFNAHINRGVEKLYNRVKSIEQIGNLLL